MAEAKPAGETAPRLLSAGMLTQLKALLFNSREGIRDVLVSMFPKGVALITGVISSVLIARGLGPARLGDYTLITSVSTLAGSLSDLGIGQPAIRYAARSAAAGDTEGQLAILRWAFRVRMALVALVSFAVFLLAPLIAERLWDAPRLTPLIRLSLVAGVFGAISSVPVIYFQSLKRFSMNATVQIGQTLISLLGVLLLAWFQAWSVRSVIANSVIALGLGAFAFVLLVPKTALFSWREFKTLLSKLPFGLWKNPLKSVPNAASTDSLSPSSFAFFWMLASVIVMLTTNANVWLMGRLLEKSQVGLYGAAVRFTIPLFVLSSALNTALWPRASALRDVPSILALLFKMLKINLVIACLGALYAIVAPLAAPYLFGSEYYSSTLIAQVLCLRYCFTILSNPIVLLGCSLGLPRYYWMINLLELVAVLTIDLVFIPVLGPLAAALALLANDLIGVVAFSILAWRTIAHLPREASPV